jgi:hypothetical protein
MRDEPELLIEERVGELFLADARLSKEDGDTIGTRDERELWTEGRIGEL